MVMRRMTIAVRGGPPVVVGEFYVVLAEKGWPAALASVPLSSQSKLKYPCVAKISSA